MARDVIQHARSVLRGARAAALRGVVGTATALCPSAAFRVLHELFNVASFDLICAHHLSGHGAAQKVNQLRLPRRIRSKQLARRIDDFVFRGIGSPVSDIFPDAGGEEERVLQNNTDLGAQRFLGNLAQIAAI